ncbi:hypothetical protein BDQ17DRAFT_1371474 [Cyathus striatus]|nr:hypothetical protein BDQ17DRAFT_1371474 [Cyathus striatus]
MHPFPVELLQEIFQLACNSSLPNLRLACKSFNEMVVPIMFSHACIRYPSSLDMYLVVLHAFATGEHPCATHAKSLQIEDLGPPEDYSDFLDDDEEYNTRYFTEVLEPYGAQLESIQNLLQLAVASCKHVTTVTWKISQNSSESTMDSVLSGLERVSSLSALALYVNLSTLLSLSLHSLPPLEVLKIHVPTRSSHSPDDALRFHGLPNLIAKSSSKLRHLNLKLYRSQNEESFLSSLARSSEPLCITHLTVSGSVHLNKSFASHLRSLRSLSLGCVSTQDRHISTAGGTWSMLKDERIYLHHIAHIESTESLLQYFRSYAGLKSLEFKEGYNGISNERSNQLTLNDYLNALTSHVSSLEDLTIVPDRDEDDWCFAERNIAALSQFINLKHLSITILADSRSTVPRGKSVKSCDDLTTNNYTPSHSVCLLLQTVSSFPNLTLLSINYTTLPQIHSPIMSMADRIEHAIHPTVQIDTHVRLFGPLDPPKYKFIVKNGNRYYTLQRMGESDEYRYCLT